ncbi:hypothetical protein IGI04_015103 [Brassica rapa subsp. trilocularis]|uniref:Uncharacterized protein n=1 Tax=Brassica rapa subsp. trilocularis TaxID=1813537 RepID=A0ABQ7MRL7_BRACM|nr:hypothetical protein IGI04_015103 [Brassica rapa subsp. trilocularis]
MGQYSYSQPSSSSAEVDVTALLEEEARLYADEARLHAERATADEAESSFDIEKAVQEATLDFQTQLRRVNEEGTEREQKLLLLEKSVHELGKDLARVKLMVCVLVVIALLFFVLRGVPSKASTGTILSPQEWPNKSADVGDPEERPIGVKAAKGGSKKKKKSGREEELSKLQNVLELKEKLSKNKLLDRLLAMKEPLSDIETSLKLKLMSEMI